MAPASDASERLRQARPASRSTSRCSRRRGVVIGGLCRCGFRTGRRQRVHLSVDRRPTPWSAGATSRPAGDGSWEGDVAGLRAPRRPACGRARDGVVEAGDGRGSSTPFVLDGSTQIVVWEASVVARPRRLAGRRISRLRPAHVHRRRRVGQRSAAVVGSARRAGPSGSRNGSAGSAGARRAGPRQRRRRDPHPAHVAGTARAPHRVARRVTGAPGTHLWVVGEGTGLPPPH